MIHFDTRIIFEPKREIINFTVRKIQIAIAIDAENGIEE